MLDFQRYQFEFTAHIRNPSLHPKPANVVETRMAIYREAIFNNIFESVSACFPVCQKVIELRAWRKLMHDFVANFATDTPLFREIPQQFLAFLNTKKDLPVYLTQLAHYEWVELSVSSQITETPNLSATSDFMDEIPVLASAHRLLQYDYPVHKISPRFKPITVEKTYLLVFRNSVFDINFIELNPITYQLLSAIENNSMTGKQALIRLADELINMDTTAILQYGGAILADLADQEAVVGSVKAGRT